MTDAAKKLGFALAAVCAMSAIAASAAQAVNGVLTAGATPSTHTAATLVGVPYAKPGGNFATENMFEAFGSKMSCTNVTAEGSVTGTDKTGTLTPSTTHCGIIASDDSLKPPITVTTNGCDYKITQPVRLAANEYTSKVDLECPTSQGPVVHIAAGGTYTSHIGNICTMEVTAGQEVGHIVAHNKSEAGKKDFLTVTVLLSNVHVVRSGLCAGAETTSANVKFISNLKVTSMGETHDVWITDEE